MLELYEDELLGEGSRGPVLLGTWRGVPVAVKEMCSESAGPMVPTIAVINHPNVVSVVGSFEDAKSIHIVMDVCKGGELFDKIIERGHYTEKDAAAMCRTMLRVIHHMHTLGVMHRDLKPENFLLSVTGGAGLGGVALGPQSAQIVHQLPHLLALVLIARGFG